jgi:hypothetical protein
MSDKIKCSVCGKECDENHWVADFESFPVLKERFGAVYICTICYWTGFLKALGVKPKENDIPFPMKDSGGLKEPVIHFSNPCDTLRRMKLEADAVAQLDTMKKQESIRTGTYEPTLIPGCPAEEMQNANSSKYLCYDLRCPNRRKTEK